MPARQAADDAATLIWPVENTPASRAVAAAVLLAGVAMALPRPALIFGDPLSPPGVHIVAAAFHVHSNLSDGGASADAIAAAAARAGIDVVVLTNHGDATREPDSPTYRFGVLCLDGVEISTTAGHYAALGLPRSPYPLGGDPRDVVEDVARLGGFGIAAHPDSRRHELAWTDASAPVDALEVINLDSGWRRSSVATAAAVLGGYWLRPPQALALLASISRAAATMWDEAVGSRRVVAIAALDAHGAMLGPSYEATFRTLSTRIELSSPLTGRAEIDAASVIAALRAGHAYLAVDALAQPPILQFHARQGSTLVTEGDDAGDARTAITFELRAAIPGGGSLMLLRNGEIVASSTTSSLTYMTKDRPGAYRAEVYVPGGRNGVLWLASNAIYVGSRRTLAPPSAAHPGAVLDLLDRETWRAEHDPASRAIAHGPTRSDSGLSLHYELGPGPAHAQFAALVRSVPQPLTEWHGVTVEAFASSQMRMSVALRTGNGDRRWQRSMYLDRLPRTIRLPFDEFTPVEANDRLRAAPLAEIAVLMLVVDCNRTMPGSGGTVTVSRVELDR